MLGILDRSLEDTDLTHEPEEDLHEQSVGLLATFDLGVRGEVLVCSCLRLPSPVAPPQLALGWDCILTQLEVVLLRLVWVSLDKVDLRVGVELFELGVYD